MNFHNITLKKIFIFFSFLFFLSNFAMAEDEKINAVTDQLQIIANDLKTLEKAVYKTSDISTAINSASSNGLNEEILTRHLLKLNEIEEQFRLLTNRFEEVNFKLDKLSNRVTKIQSDSQLRFSDLESGNVPNTGTTEKTQKRKKKVKEKVKLPGTDKPQDLGAAPGYSLTPEKTTQATQSVQAQASVFTEERKSETSLLPNKPPKEQYDFALSFMKVGDYETAEQALREFIDKNKTDKLAGSAQYWYGETFRIRQLYSDAATAYLDGYQNYPKSRKAPENLLKLGTTMVQLGEKDQGCKMIKGIKKEYPKASQSVLQKARYEEKRFKCSKA
jgi:tol-pal system protein YbgF